jgi:hypothetical protein
VQLIGMEQSSVCIQAAFDAFDALEKVGKNTSFKTEVFFAWRGSQATYLPTEGIFDLTKSNIVLNFDGPVKDGVIEE